MVFQEYMQVILPRCSAFFRDHGDADAEYVIDKIELTEMGFDLEDTAPEDVMGLLGIQHLVAALYYSNNDYRVEKAAEHARSSRENFASYLDRVGSRLSPQERQTTGLYRDAAANLEAYCALQQDEFDACLQMLTQRDLSPLVLAMAGTAACRLAYEVPGRENFAYVAYDLLNRMDGAIQGPFQWLHEEDIFRTAYSFLTLLVTDAGNAFPQETRIPQSRSRALEYSLKIYSMLTDPQQKAWAMEEIENYQN